MTGAGPDGARAKPAGAWTAEQTVEYMLEKVFEDGDFYVICPDNDTTSVSKPRALRCGQW
jgi:hypothetical protein